MSVLATGAQQNSLSHWPANHLGASVLAKIGLLSDTHGYLDPRVFEIFEDRDEIWHAGDFGVVEISHRLSDFKPLRAVYGNIDGPEIRDLHPEHQRFEIEGLDVWMTHIGGYPGRYDRCVREEIQRNPPGLFVCGHSHILKVKPDKKLGLLHLNPGAAGNSGSQSIKTMMMLTIESGSVSKLQAVDLGPRGTRHGEAGQSRPRDV
jgi:putative phosphoesterase